MRVIDKVLKEGAESAYETAANYLHQHSNDAINKAFNVLGNGAIDLWNVAARSMEEVTNDQGKQVAKGLGRAFQETFKEGEKYNMKRIAASGFIAGAGLRVATGGGLYRDSNGSQDIIGIPFI